MPSSLVSAWCAQCVAGIDTVRSSTQASGRSHFTRYSGSSQRTALCAPKITVSFTTVSNDGPPIPQELHERIFERCFRVDEPRAGCAAGSGLGLAIVKSIMDLHDGTATVISGLGRRTMFRLWFPGPARAAVTS